MMRPPKNLKLWVKKDRDGKVIQGYLIKATAQPKAKLGTFVEVTP